MQFGFPTTPVGQAVQWLPQFRNPYGQRATLYVSWTPALTRDIGRHNGPNLGPFRLTFGQRFELRSGERQKVQMFFQPTKPGAFHARLYIWWDYANRLGWEQIIDFHGTAVAPPPPPPVPCIDQCWNAYKKCASARTAGSACQSTYTQCAGRCDIAFGDGTFWGATNVDVGSVPVGQARDTPHFGAKNQNGVWPFRRDSYATLYVSWTPLHKNDPGRTSPPVLGPFEIQPFQRKEVRGKRTANFWVRFRPAEAGVYNARLYVWWDYRGKIGYERLYDIRGSSGGRSSLLLSSTSSEQGGAESFPAWMFPSGDRAPPLWKNLDGLGRSGETLAVAPRRRRAVMPGGPASPIALHSLVPPQFANLTPTFHEPEQIIIGGNNAIESLAADYVDGEGRVLAAVLALRTRVDAYAHVYAVCSRVKGSWLEDARFESVPVPGGAAPASFWEATTTARDPEGEPHREIATGFAVYVSRDRTHAVIDSQWLSEDYPLHADAEADILNVQIWSPDAATTAALRRRVLELLRARTFVEYRNTAARPSPDLYVAEAKYEGGEAQLQVTNRTGVAKNALLTAVTWTAANPQSRREETFTRLVEPGTSSITLPLAGRLNGVIYIAGAGTSWRDMVYFADGYWFSFGDGAPPAWTAPDCPTSDWTSEDLVLAGCARLTTPIPRDGWRGVGRALTTWTRNGMVIEPSRALTFFAKGPSVTAEARIVTESEPGIRKTYAAFFTPTPEGRTITIPLSEFRGREHADGTFIADGERLIEIQWMVTGSPHDESDLFIGNVAFTDELRLDAAGPETSVSVATEPTPVTARLQSDHEGLESTLVYRRRGDTAWTRVPMTMNADESDLAIADIPAQPQGTIVEWYTELRDADGHLTTAPYDAPFDPGHFAISTQQQRLVDDFEDDRVKNRQGASDWTFTSERAALTAEAADGAERLRSLIPDTASYSGWVADLADPVDTSEYDALLLRVRGSRGGELFRIGLGDADRVEQKVVLAKFVEGGIGPAWREARVPLSVFTQIDRTRVARIVVVFEGELETGGQTIDIDDLRLAATGASPVLPLANFDDASTQTAVGESYFTATGGPAIVDARRSEEARFGAIGSGYRVHAKGDVASWVTLAFETGSVDARAFNAIRFRARGAVGGEQVHVYLVTGPPGAEVRTYVQPQALTNAWQDVVIPLQTFASGGADLSFVRRVEIVWEWRDFDETVDLDDLELGGTVPQATSKSRAW